MPMVEAMARAMGGRKRPEDSFALASTATMASAVAAPVEAAVRATGDGRRKRVTMGFMVGAGLVAAVGVGWVILIDGRAPSRRGSSRRVVGAAGGARGARSTADPGTR